MSEPSGSSAGLLLVIAGIALVTLTLVGGLVERITGSGSTTSTTAPAKASSKASVKKATP
jgi:flagellar basal body-associated protein FliL